MARSQREFSVTKMFFSLRHPTQFPVPTLQMQSSDNVASLWGKILLGSEIQEKNAENNLKEIKGKIKKEDTRMSVLYESSTCTHTRMDLGVIANVYIQRKPAAGTARPGSVSVTESSLISKKTRCESSAPW